MIHACPSCGTMSSAFQTVSTASIKKLWKDKLDMDIVLSKPEYSLCNCPTCSLGFISPVCEGDIDFYNDLTDRIGLAAFPSFKEEFKYVGDNYVYPDTTVLDIGCGDGALSKFVIEKGGIYTGIDFSSSSCSLAKEGIEVLNTSLEAFCTPPLRQFDVVVISQVLEHIADPATFIARALTVLKPNGVVIITVPNADSYLKYNANNLYNSPPHHVGRWTEKALKHLCVNTFHLAHEHTFIEVLQDVHDYDYAQAYLDSFGFRIVPPYISDSWYYKLTAWLAKFTKHFVDAAYPGHSITTVFRK